MIKYRIEYKFLNLNVSEIRDLKLNVLDKKDLVAIETIDVAPRIPGLKEHIVINEITFQIVAIRNKFFNEDEFLVNLISIDLLDFVKKEKEDRELEELKNKKERKIVKIDKYDYYFKKWVKDGYVDKKNYYLSEEDKRGNWIDKNKFECRFIIYNDPYKYLNE